MVNLHPYIKHEFNDSVAFTCLTGMSPEALGKALEGMSTAQRAHALAGLPEEMRRKVLDAQTDASRAAFELFFADSKTFAAIQIQHAFKKKKEEDGGDGKGGGVSGYTVRRRRLNTSG